MTTISTMTAAAGGITTMTRANGELLHRFAQAAWIDETVRVTGDVGLGQGVSLWTHSVIRAECTEVRIGPYTNLQDHVMVHVGFTLPTIVGAYCSITHRVVLHGCTIGDNCLIGIGATLMDGVVIGENSIVAGHTLIPEGKVVPPNSVVMGTPGKVVRTANSFIANRLNAWLYHRNALAYARGDYRAWTGEEFERARREEEARVAEEFRSRYPDPARG
jgi:carbonic anhydrase/acetyltransferase-like protein (isoleucine patch superfamily)